MVRETGRERNPMRRKHTRDPEHKKLLRQLESHFVKDERAGSRSRNPIHTAQFDSCVKSVKKRLRGVANPYAVCMAALGKKALRRK